MDMKNLIFIFLTLIFAEFVSGNVSFDVACTDETVPINGTAEITITAEWPQGSNTYVIYTPLMPQLLGLKIIDHITFGQATTINSQIVQRVVHLFKFSITNNAGTETGPIFIDYRLSGSNEKLHHKLPGIKFTTVRFQHNILKILILSGVLILLIPIISTIIIIQLSRKKTKKSVLNNSSIEDAIIEELEKVKRYKIEGNIKRYFHKLDELIKKYFRIKYQIGSLLDVNPESNGKAGPDKHTLLSACELLKLSHNVCYADYQPSNPEQDRIYNFLKKILLNNRPHKPQSEEELFLRMD